MVTEARKGYDSDTSNEQDYPDLIQELAQEIDILYTSDQSAPAGWHLKEQLKKELRQEVRKRSNQAGLNELMSISTRIEDYALKNYIRVL
jgi:type I restriction enzyme R subunit